MVGGTAKPAQSNTRSRPDRSISASYGRWTEWKYTPTDSAGVTIVDICFCAGDFGECGMKSTVAQTNISFNYTRGTSRGLHRQMPPYAAAKLVRRTRGAIADVAVDVRPESQTYHRHASGMGFWSGAKL
jgi:hypothetical protein